MLSQIYTWKSDFNRYWLSQSIAQFMAELIVVFVPFVAISILAVPSEQVGLLSAAAYAPVILVTPLLATKIDSIRRLPIMVAAHWGRAITYLGMVFLSLAGVMNLGILIVMVLIAGTCTAIFDLSTQVFIPNLVPGDELVSANSKIQGTRSAAQVAGPALGGLLIVAGKPWLAFAILALSYCLSASLLSRVQASERLAAVTGDSFIRRFLAGYKIAFSEPVLRGLLINSTWYNCFDQVMLTIFMVYAIRFANWSDFTVGLVLGIGAIGAIGGSLTATWLRRIPPKFALIAFSGLAALAPAALILVTDDSIVSISSGLIAFIVYGVGTVTYNIHSVTLRQLVTNKEQLGQVSAAYRMFAYGSVAVGGLISSFLISVLGLRGALIATVLALIIGWSIMSVYLHRVLPKEAI